MIAAFAFAALFSLGLSEQIHYDIEVRLDPSTRSMDVSVDITVPAGAWEDSQYPILLSKEFGEKDVSEPALMLNGQSVVPSPTEESERSTRRYVTIDPERTNVISAKYSSVKNEGRVFKLGEYASYVSGTNLKWYPSTISQVVSANMRFDVPKGQVVKATGKLVGVTEAGDRSIYEFYSAGAASLSFAVGPYKVYRDDTGDVPVAIYVFTERKWTGKAVKTLRQVADTLGDWFGPYPSDEMAFVEVEPSESFGGASAEGFVFSGPTFIDSAEGPNLAFIGHELAHAWWGHQIKPDGVVRYMLDEAMAQFGSLKAVEAIDGPRAARAYRTTGYPGYVISQCATGALRAMSNGYDPPLARLTGSEAHHHSDAKGFQVYHQLEQVIGTKSLKNAFRRIQSDFAWQRIGVEQLFELIGQHSGTDLSWFYDQWFERPGAPKWNVRWRQNGGSLEVDVEQPQAPYRFVTEVEALMKDGTKKRWSVNVAGSMTNLRFAVDGSVQAVVLDPDWDVFHWDPELMDLDNDGVKKAS